MICRLFLMAFVILFTNPIIPLASERDVESIVKKIDALYRSKTSVADMEMQIVTPHLSDTSACWRYWRRWAWGGWRVASQRNFLADSNSGLRLRGPSFRIYY